MDSTNTISGESLALSTTTNGNREEIIEEQASS